MRCLVSIPPLLRGEIFADSFGTSLQHRLIRSWLDAGLKPVSINTSKELNDHPRHAACLKEAGVDVVIVEPSAGNYPPYLPNVRASIVKVASLYPGEVIAIINADIHILFDDRACQAIRNLDKASFLVAHRLDVADDSMFSQTIAQRLSKGSNSPFIPGIDFIAAHSETFKAASHFLSPDLTLGLPWWDLLLPIALYAAGATRTFLESVYFLHIKHEERWDPVWLDQIGTVATRYLDDQIKGYKSPAAAYVWSLAYQALVSPIQSPRIYKSRILSKIGLISAGRRCPAYLLDVLRMTEAMVCQNGWEQDERWISAWVSAPLL